MSAADSRCLKWRRSRCDRLRNARNWHSAEGYLRLVISLNDLSAASTQWSPSCGVQVVWSSGRALIAPTLATARGWLVLQSADLPVVGARGAGRCERAINLPCPDPRHRKPRPVSFGSIWKAYDGMDVPVFIFWFFWTLTGILYRKKVSHNPLATMVHGMYRTISELTEPGRSRAVATSWWSGTNTPKFSQQHTQLALQLLNLRYPFRFWPTNSAAYPTCVDRGQGRTIPPWMVHVASLPASRYRPVRHVCRNPMRALDSESHHLAVHGMPSRSSM